MVAVVVDMVAQVTMAVVVEMGVEVKGWVAIVVVVVVGEAVTGGQDGSSKVRTTLCYHILVWDCKLKPTHYNAKVNSLPVHSTNQLYTLRNFS